MRPLFSLAGRVALVTGAASGLGLAIAQAFAEHGAQVLLVDRDATGAQAAASALVAGGASAHAIACDLADKAAVARLVDEAPQRFGRVDILVCNAGMQGPAGPLAEASDADWAQVMTVNLQSAAWLCNALIPAMAERGAGRVILMASIAALRGNKHIGLYGISKAGLAALARNLAVEWGPRGVNVNAIAPGLIRTPFARELTANAAFMEHRLAQTPLRRIGEPDEIAGVAVLLASAAGGFITGQTLVVDGGTTISDGN